MPDEFELGYDLATGKFRLRTLYPLEDESEWFEMLQSIYIFWDREVSGWGIPPDRFREIQLWFERHWLALLITTGEAQFEYNRWAAEAYRSELKTFRSMKFNPDLVPKKSDLELYEFQVDGIKSLIKRNRTYLADDAGLAKCLTYDEYIEVKVSWRTYIKFQHHRLCKLLIKYGKRIYQVLSILWKVA
jgi:hypothetical protein